MDIIANAASTIAEEMKKIEEMKDKLDAKHTAEIEELERRETELKKNQREEVDALNDDVATRMFIVKDTLIPELEKEIEAVEEGTAEVVDTVMGKQSPARVPSPRVAANEDTLKDDIDNLKEELLPQLLKIIESRTSRPDTADFAKKFTGKRPTAVSVKAIAYTTAALTDEAKSTLCRVRSMHARTPSAPSTISALVTATPSHAAVRRTNGCFPSRARSKSSTRARRPLKRATTRMKRTTARATITFSSSSR